MKFSIKQAREYRGLTAQEMAESIGIHPNTYSKKEKDERLFTVGEILKILPVINMEWSDLSFCGKSD